MVVPGKTLLRGTAAPSGTSPRGALFVDSTNENAYMNRAGGTDWDQLDVAVSGDITLATVFGDCSPTTQWSGYWPGNGSIGFFQNGNSSFITTSPTFARTSEGWRDGCRPSSTSNGADGGLYCGNTAYHFRRENNFRCTAKVNLSDTTDRRYYILAAPGWVDPRSIIDSDNPASALSINYVGFRFSTAVPDTNIQFVSGDGTTQNVIASSATVPGIYIFQLFADEATASITARILNAAGTSVVDEKVLTTNIPGSTNGLRFSLAQKNLASGSQPVMETWSLNATHRSA